MAVKYLNENKYLLKVHGISRAGASGDGLFL